MKQSGSAVMMQSESSDRISQLPDAVLGHILSFVPFKQSVQTSILSKRWPHVWTYLPIIDVDDSTLLLELMVFEEHSVHASFINFLSNVLINRCHKAPIHKFILNCSKFDLFRVNQWIAAAVKRRIQELDLCIITEKVLKMSCSVFAYQELVSLKLGRKFVLDVPGLLLFPSLVKLHLVDIDFDDETIHNFLSGCPVLEDLDIVCTTDKWNKLVINVPALKFFTIVASSSVERYKFEFILESPNLQVLKYTGPEASEGFCFRDLNSLVKAEMDIASCGDITNREIEIVKGIANAKIIWLTDSTSKVISYLNLPIFHNVTEMRLGLSNRFSRKLFSQLLHNSPNLQVLVFVKELTKKRNLDGFRWERPASVPECFSLHLEVVNVWGFEKQEWVGEFIKYVLQNAKVLKECWASSDKTKLEEVKLNTQLLKYLTE